MALEQLQQFAKRTWHPRIFAKNKKKISLQQVGKSSWHFGELGILGPSTRIFAPASVACHREFVRRRCLSRAREAVPPFLSRAREQPGAASFISRVQRREE